MGTTISSTPIRGLVSTLYAIYSCDTREERHGTISIKYRKEDGKKCIVQNVDITT